MKDLETGDGVVIEIFGYGSVIGKYKGHLGKRRTKRDKGLRRDQQGPGGTRKDQEGPQETKRDQERSGDEDAPVLTKRYLIHTGIGARILT